jgi:glycolate oxidase
MTRLIQQLRDIVGNDGVLYEPEDLMLYEYDGGITKAVPDAVVLPRNTEQVVRLVKLAARERVPLVPRGAGTGLSGGAIPVAGGVVMGFSRMNRILELDLDNLRAVVEPGVVNTDITAAASAGGYFFAPDPSSQKACTIGGNVAENAGGPHTLAYGVTTNHILGLEAVLPDGSVIHTGGKEDDVPGYDLTGLLVGSEGTLAIITRAIVRLMRQPEAVKTLLSVFDSVDDASRAVAEITARTITPVALETLDHPMLKAIEEFCHAGYPLDAGAVLLIELEGLREQIEHQAVQVAEVCKECRAREVRLAKTARERELLWVGRKNAFGAVGRVTTHFYVQDGVVPRSKLPDTMRVIQQVSAKYGLTICNIFHAGDGNLHPIILFDERVPGQHARVVEAATEILKYCIEAGGSITGEHGVGIEKRNLMPLLFGQDDLEAMRAIKCVFNPGDILNPQKLLPSAKSCLELNLSALEAARRSVGSSGPPV